MAESVLRTTLGELIFDKNALIQVSSETTVEDAAKMMKKHNIISAPVFDSSKGQYIGIIDMFEIMRFTAVGFFEESIFKDDLFTKFEFSKETVGDLVQKSQRCQRILSYEGSEPIIAAIRNLGELDHRALVRTVDDKSFQKVYRIITQTDLVRFIQKHEGKLQKYLDKRIDELGLANPLGTPTVCITTKDKAVVGFYKMFYNKVNAVAVVDESGKLVANLSCSDLRGLSSDTIQYVRLPPLSFIQSMTGEKPSRPITCRVKDHLNLVIDQMVSANVHRVWITDSAEKPIGVVTLTDVLRCFADVHQSK